jgi:hypothetical protein
VPPRAPEEVAAKPALPHSGGMLSIETQRRATTGNTRSREASGTAGGPRSLGQRPNDLAHILAWSR